MSVWPRWSEDEVELLIALFERTGGSPKLSDLELLRERLLVLADPEYREDPSYRSIDSIRSQLTWVRDLAWDRPRAPDAPAAFQAAWARHREAPSAEGHPPRNGAASDRRELVRILEVVRATLTELVESPEYLPAALRSSYATAWKDLEARGYIDAAVSALHGPAVDDLLAAHGLVGPQRVAKTESVDAALRERRRRRGWGPLKALLGYLDSILGSLTAVFPWLDAILEFKEISEASAGLAKEVTPDDRGSR